MLIEIREYNGRYTHVGVDAIVKVSPASPSCSWHGIRSYVKLTDGSTIESSDDSDAILAVIRNVGRMKHDAHEMREMLRAMQAGELTVSRGVELLEMWLAGNYSDEQLPPVRQDLIEEDSMPVEIIDRLRAEVERLRQQRDELIAAVREAINDAEECSDADDWTTMLMSLEAFHNLDTAYYTALAKIEGEK